MNNAESDIDTMGFSKEVLDALIAELRERLRGNFTIAYCEGFYDVECTPIAFRSMEELVIDIESFVDRDEWLGEFYINHVSPQGGYTLVRENGSILARDVPYDFVFYLGRLK